METRDGISDAMFDVADALPRQHQFSLGEQLCTAALSVLSRPVVRSPEGSRQNSPHLPSGLTCGTMAWLAAVSRRGHMACIQGVPSPRRKKQGSVSWSGHLHQDLPERCQIKHIGTNIVCWASGSPWCNACRATQPIRTKPPSSGSSGQHVCAFGGIGIQYSLAWNCARWTATW